MPERHIDDFIVHERQRKLFKPQPIEDLAKSIEEKGLMHAVVATEDGTGLRLVAGERRMRAMELLHKAGRSFFYNSQVVTPKHIPYVLLKELDEYSRKEAELEENILREDLTWQERNEAIAELHRLRTEKNPEHSKGDTAREISERTETPMASAYRSVNRAIILDQFREDPEVARAPNEKEAFKIATRKIEEEFRSATQAPPVARGTYACIHGDCREVLPGLKPGMFSAIIVDPPYGMGADQFGDAAQNIHHYSDTRDEAIPIAEAIFYHGQRLLKPNAFIFLFCDIDYFQELRTMAETHSFVPWRTPIIWSKGGMGHAPDPQRGPKRTYETILLARKGDMRIKQAFSDVITIPPEKERYHAAQKPVELYKHLLNWGCEIDDHVLDPCCGAGTIFHAAKDLQLRALGIEKDDRFFRLSQSVSMEVRS